MVISPAQKKTKKQVAAAAHIILASKETGGWSRALLISRKIMGVIGNRRAGGVLGRLALIVPQTESYAIVVGWMHLVSPGTPSQYGHAGPLPNMFLLLQVLGPLEPVRL